MSVQGSPGQPSPADVDRPLAYVHEQPRVRVLFEDGALGKVPDEVRRLGWRTVLLIGGQPPQENVGNQLADALDDVVGARIVDIQQHVPLPEAQQATAIATDIGADGLVALGGGSAVGLAKAVALDSGLPILAVPTTYAGSEMTPVWGRTDAGRKVTGRDERVRPVVVVYDPCLTLGLPPALTAVSALNALAHCVEAAYAGDASPLTRLVAAAGADALCGSLTAAVRDGDGLHARRALLHGASLAGTALGAASMGVHHATCHLLGGMLGLPHAETHAVVLPHAVAFNTAAVPERLAPLAKGLGVPVQHYAGALWDLARSVQAPRSLRQLGMAEQDLNKAAAASTATV